MYSHLRINKDGDAAQNAEAGCHSKEDTQRSLGGIIFDVVFFIIKGTGPRKVL
jgi:hypothetical protein